MDTAARISRFPRKPGRNRILTKYGTGSQNLELETELWTSGKAQESISANRVQKVTSEEGHVSWGRDQEILENKYFLTDNSRTRSTAASSESPQSFMRKKTGKKGVYMEKPCPRPDSCQMQNQTCEFA